MNSLNRFADPIYCIARLIIGLLFACHGGQKIFEFPPGGHGAAHGALMVSGGWIELACGFLIAFGLLARIAAFVAAGEMAVAYFMMHAKGGFFPIVNHGEAAVFYCFFFLFVLFHGPGRWSLDAMLFKRGAAATATAS
jgi:putative oxidoreductase